MRDFLDKAISYEPAKIPLGNAGGLLVGTGLAGGLEEVIKGFLPANWKKYSGIPLGLGLAYIFKNVKFFENFLGEKFTDALAIGAIFHGIESTFFVRARITGAISGLATKATPAVATAGVETATQPTAVQTSAAPEGFVSSVDEKLRATLAVS